jgi:hypothetical protein
MLANNKVVSPETSRYQYAFALGMVSSAKLSMVRLTYSADYSHEAEVTNVAIVRRNRTIALVACCLLVF